MAPWRPPADAWTRRDFLHNGFMSAALLCTVATPASLSRKNPLVTSAALRAQRARRSSRSAATCR